MNIYDLLVKANADAANAINARNQVMSSNNPKFNYPSDDHAAVVYEDVRDEYVYIQLGGHTIAVYKDGSAKLI